MKNIVLTIILTSVMASSLQAVGTSEFFNKIKKQSWKSITDTISNNRYTILLGTGFLVSSILLYLEKKEKNKLVQDKLQSSTNTKELKKKLTDKNQLINLLCLFPQKYQQSLITAFNKPEELKFTIQNEEISLKNHMASTLLKEDYGIVLSTVLAKREKMFALEKSGYRYFSKTDELPNTTEYHLGHLLKDFAEDYTIEVPSVLSGHNDKLNYIFTQAQKENIRLATYIKENPERYKKLTSTYKIHIMSKEEDVFLDAARIIDLMRQDKKFADSIVIFKIKEDIYNYKQQGETMPLIVVYPKPGKENAQYVLDALYKLYGNEEGLNETPRYNVKVTSKIYWAQGNGDHKGKQIHKALLDLLYNEDRTVYNDILETGEDQALKDPSKE